MLFSLKNWPLCLSTLSDKKYIFEWMKPKNGADAAQIRRQSLNQAVGLVVVVSLLCFALLRKNLIDIWLTQRLSGKTD